MEKNSLNSGWAFAITGSEAAHTRGPVIAPNRNFISNSLFLKRHGPPVCEPVMFVVAIWKYLDLGRITLQFPTIPSDGRVYTGTGFLLRFRKVAKPIYYTNAIHTIKAISRI